MKLIKILKKYLSILLVFALFPALCACGAEKDAENRDRDRDRDYDREDGNLIYFLAPADKARGGDRIRSSRERLDLDGDAPLRETACAVVERLLAGSSDGKLQSPLPAGVELLSLDVRDRWAYVDLSGGINRLEGVDLALADYCLTLSLTALDGISAVSVTAQGRAMGQQPKQAFYERDVLLSTMGDVLQSIDVTLYFLNGENALTGERRTLELYEGQTVAEKLTAALLEGPQNRELSRVLPEDFQINFVRIENGVCYVSIADASLEALPEDENLQQMMLWSLADSLYSIEAVEALRLLSDGEELAFFGEVPVESASVRPQG